MMTNNTFQYGQLQQLPRWLEEHCERLEEQNSPIRNLNLNIRRLDSHMAFALCNSLSKNQNIEIVNLTSSFTMNPTLWTVRPLAQYLASPHSSLQIIHLSYNRLVDVTELGLALQTNTKLKELHLDYNYLDTASAVALAEGLARNRQLRVLQLKSNRIGDVGGQALALALGKNTTLQTLGLSRNQDLGELTQRALAYSLQDNVTLTNLQLTENPKLVRQLPMLLYFVRANQAGRHLLRKEVEHLWTLWPLILQGLEPDMLYFFLKERPDFVPSSTLSEKSVLSCL